MSLFLHQTTTSSAAIRRIFSCICLYSYIKPQLWLIKNILAASCICLYSYIKPQLSVLSYAARSCCICLYSYIKPQLDSLRLMFIPVVYVSIPTSNHNPFYKRCLVNQVVYVSIPTSNHNYRPLHVKSCRLYMSLFLHQTTTRPAMYLRMKLLYMSLFLHQTTTVFYE